MDVAFRISWLIFAISLTAAVVGYALWPGGPISSVSDVTGDVRTTSPAALFFLLPAFHGFSLAVAHGSVRARPRMSARQFRQVVVVGTALGLAVSHALLIAKTFGVAVNHAAATSSIAGLLIIVCGNYLPKCAREDSVALPRPWNYLFSIPWNLPLAYLFGIRTWWTLASDHVWNRTHRLASRLWIAGGLIYLFAGWFVTGQHLLNLLSLAWVLITIVPILYSFTSWLGDRQRAAA